MIRRHKNAPTSCWPSTGQEYAFLPPLLPQGSLCSTPTVVNGPRYKSSRPVRALAISHDDYGHHATTSCLFPPSAHVTPFFACLLASYQRENIAIESAQDSTKNTNIKQSIANVQHQEQKQRPPPKATWFALLLWSRHFFTTKEATATSFDCWRVRKYTKKTTPLKR